MEIKEITTKRLKDQRRYYLSCSQVKTYISCDGGSVATRGNNFVILHDNTASSKKKTKEQQPYEFHIKCYKIIA